MTDRTAKPYALPDSDATPEMFNEAVTGVRNDEMMLAWKLVTQTGVNLFLTGKAGTGKTTFLRRLREESPKRMVVLAPTGVAAINAQGQTIHSFFQLPFGPIVPGMEREQRKSFRMTPEKKNLIRTLDLLVIDEISMVRADLLDAIDTELRRHRRNHAPFGGVQLLLIGDLRQLPPVVKDSEWKLLSPYYESLYFFGSKALSKSNFVTVELNHIYRQQDSRFIDILAKVRDNRLDQAALNELNARYIPGFKAPVGESWIRLTTHNRMADEYNDSRLAALPSTAVTYKAKVVGNFPESSYPADAQLRLKVGAQVMFIKNDPTQAHAFYNGKIGVVTAVDLQKVTVKCAEDLSEVEVVPLEWENAKYTLDPASKEIKEEIEGVFTQLPLRLAWAITVHKSQGLTFDRAVLDINDSFAHGQAYVALSRCRTLQGLVLARPIDGRAVITDSSINAFIDTEARKSGEVKSHLPAMLNGYFASLLDDMFSFEMLRSDMAYLHRVVAEHLYKQQPTLLERLTEALPLIDSRLTEVAMKFATQYRSILAVSADPDHDPKLQERIKAAIKYFSDELAEICVPVVVASRIKIANKQIAKQYGNALDAFALSLRIKEGTFKRLSAAPFTIRNFLTARAKASLDPVMPGVVAQSTARRRKTQR